MISSVGDARVEFRGFGKPAKTVFRPILDQKGNSPKHSFGYLESDTYLHRNGRYIQWRYMA